MRCWVVPAWGTLTTEDRPLPAPGPGQVRVGMRGASLNYRDLLMFRGHYDRRVLPYVPLSDGAGVVEAVGDGVTRVAVGDRVMFTFSPSWLGGAPDLTAVRRTRGGPIDGVLADAVVVGEDELVVSPAHLSDVEAATLPCAGLTAWSALELAGIGAGDTVLTLGTGGVSLFALQLALARGARVVSTTSSEDKAARLAELGAAHVLDYTADETWGRTVRRWSGGGVDAVVEVGGAPTLAQSLDAVKVGGSVAMIGVVAGHEAVLSVLPILMKQICIQGVFVGSRDGLEALSGAVSASTVRPVVDRVYPVQDTEAALAYLAGRGHMGKVALTWEGS